MPKLIFVSIMIFTSFICRAQADIANDSIIPKDSRSSLMVSISTLLGFNGGLLLNYTKPVFVDYGGKGVFTAGSSVMIANFPN